MADENVKMGKNKQLRDELGITRKQAQELIRMYAKNHGGEVDTGQIISDMKEIASEMIKETGALYHEYDISHELYDCGKDRVYDAIMNLVYKEDDTRLSDLARSYLSTDEHGGIYANSTSLWATTLISVAQKQLDDTLEAGIESYRGLVDSIENQNIQRVASVFGRSNEVMKFLAEHGTGKDFKDFCTYQAYSSRREDGLLFTLPAQVRKELLNQIKSSEKVADVDLLRLRRDCMSIYRNQHLTDEQKQQLQSLYIKNALSAEKQEFVFDNGLRCDLTDEHNALIMNIVKENTYVPASELAEIVLNNEPEKAIRMCEERISKDMEEKYQQMVDSIKGYDEKQVLRGFPEVSQAMTECGFGEGGKYQIVEGHVCPIHLEGFPSPHMDIESYPFKASVDTQEIDNVIERIGHDLKDRADEAHAELLNAHDISGCYVYLDKEEQPHLIASNGIDFKIETIYDQSYIKTSAELYSCTEDFFDKKHSEPLYETQSVSDIDAARESQYLPPLSALLEEALDERQAVGDDGRMGYVEVSRLLHSGNDDIVHSESDDIAHSGSDDIGDDR